MYLIRNQPRYYPFGFLWILQAFLNSEAISINEFSCQKDVNTNTKPIVIYSLHLDTELKPRHNRQKDDIERNALTMEPKYIYEFDKTQ